jgi:hypothetical protein
VLFHLALIILCTLVRIRVSPSVVQLHMTCFIVRYGLVMEGQS